MCDPTPIPQGMTEEQLWALPFTESNWRKSDIFVCVACKEPAFYHPHSNYIWACKKCGYRTAGVGIAFQHIDNVSIPRCSSNMM